MQVLVTGATGLVGEAVAQRCIAESRITSVVILSRRQPSKTISDNPKVTVIIHENFLSYPDDLLVRLRGTQACIWALGLKGAPLGYADPVYAEEVDVKYPAAAAEAFAQYMCPAMTTENPFNFVLCSGIGAETDPNKAPVFLRETKLLKGRAEEAVRQIARNENQFEVYACRPFGIRPENPSLFQSVVLSTIPSLKVSELAAAMLEIAVSGSKQSTWEHNELRDKGRALLLKT